MHIWQSIYNSGPSARNAWKKESLRKKFPLLLSALVLSGCLHAAPETAGKPAEVKAPLGATYVEKTIVKGKTTKDEIVAALGVPNAITRNTALPTPEMLAKAKGPLPPIASTVEFWDYWTTPSPKELELATTAGRRPEIFRLRIFMNKDGVAVEYLTESRLVDLSL